MCEMSVQSSCFWLWGVRHNKAQGIIARGLDLNLLNRIESDWDHSGCVVRGSEVK